MANISFEVAFIILLVFANGIFSLAEMAIVSSRKARLRHQAEEGSHGAAVALELAGKQDDFLSTVQVGITLVGTLAGAFGGATIAEVLDTKLQDHPAVAPYSEGIAISVVVIVITYATLILGELVPKRLALSNPEGIARAVARPMRALSRLGRPVVWFLTASTTAVMKLIPLKQAEQGEPEDEIKVLLAEGIERGTFKEGEQEMVEGVFRLGDRMVIDLMQPRGKVVFLDATHSWEHNLRNLTRTPHSRFPVLDGGPDSVVGVVHVKDLFLASRNGEPQDLRTLAKAPLLLPEITPALDALEQFRESGQQMGIVVDEHGSIQGLVTLTDLMEAIVGELRGPGEAPKPRITKREDGSWLADGSLPIASLLEGMNLDDVPGGANGFSTVGGLILAHLRRIPTPGDNFTIEDWRFEVVDMDGHRVDKVLVSNV